MDGLLEGLGLEGWPLALQVGGAGAGPVAGLAPWPRHGPPLVPLAQPGHGEGGGVGVDGVGAGAGQGGPWAGAEPGPEGQRLPGGAGQARQAGQQEGHAGQAGRGQEGHPRQVYHHQPTRYLQLGTFYSGFSLVLVSILFSILSFPFSGSSLFCRCCMCPGVARCSLALRREAGLTPNKHSSEIPALLLLHILLLLLLLPPPPPQTFLLSPRAGGASDMAGRYTALCELGLLSNSDV